MSILDLHLSGYKRETDKANRLRGEIARHTSDKARKQAEIGRTKSASRISTLSREIQRLDDQIAKANKNLASAEKSATDYQRKADKERERIQKSQEAEQKKLLRQRDAHDRQVQRSLEQSSSQLLEIEQRLTSVEETLLNSVRDAIAFDPNEREFDVFLSHTSEDLAISDALYNEFSSLDLLVWYDGAEIELGRSLSRQIDLGITRSRLAVILITPAFLKGRYWTEKEMGGFLSSRKRIIPILAGATRDDLAAYSALLTDLAGLDTEHHSVSVIAERIANTVNK